MSCRGIPGAIALALLALLASGCSFTGFRSFGAAGQADVPHERLFDLGVADFNEDGRLDMFTVNHKFAGVWLRNEGGRFEDVTTAVGGDPDPEFPGLDALTAPDMSEPGVYVYMTDSREGEPGLVHIRTVGMPAAGKIGFLSASLRILRARDARIRLGKNQQSVRVVSFDAEPGATIVIDPSSVADAPMAAFFDEPADPSSIKVGADGTSPETLDFRLTLHDRHGIAFADLVGGPAIDAFVVSGGLGGGIGKEAFRGRINDEMLSGDDDSFTEVAKAAGLNKGGCRGRQVESIDANGDGLLDIFESCEEHRPKLYRQIEPGRFGKISAPPATGTADRWVYLDPGGPPSLISAGAGEVDVWKRRGGAWVEDQTLPGNASGDVAQIALGDVDDDGDLDVLAVAPTGNTLLRNTGGRLRPVPVGSAGVPAASAAASFLDYDNDGRTDVYAVPQGLIRNTGSGYEETGLLTTPPAGAAISNWADFDGDGLRDPVIAYGSGEFASQMKVRRARNITPIHGHWLEVDLAGAAGNRQAIGASVGVRTADGRQVQWVGQNDDAPHSEGHYRLYFGLGLAESIDSMTVHWPNGERTEIGPRPADQLIRIEQP